MMRDHPMHDIGMLGSAWGVKLLKDKVRLKWRKAWKDGFQDGDGLMWKARNLTGMYFLINVHIQNMSVFFGP